MRFTCKSVADILHLSGLHWIRQANAEGPDAPDVEVRQWWKQRGLDELANWFTSTSYSLWRGIEQVSIYTTPLQTYGTRYGMAWQ